MLPRGARFTIPDHPIEHLGVALKHEGVDLRALDRLFAHPIGRELTAWIDANRAGIYTRRAWFLYEGLTGRRLDIAEPHGARFIPLLDPNRYVVARGIRSERHKVEDNLPGVPGFCPLIRRTERLAPARTDELAAAARAMVFDADGVVLPVSAAILEDFSAAALPFID